MYILCIFVYISLYVLIYLWMYFQLYLFDYLHRVQLYICYVFIYALGHFRLYHRISCLFSYINLYVRLMQLVHILVTLRIFDICIMYYHISVYLYTNLVLYSYIYICIYGQGKVFIYAIFMFKCLYLGFYKGLCEYNVRQSSVIYVCIYTTLKPLYVCA